MFEQKEIPVEGYEIHMGETEAGKDILPFVRLSTRSEGVHHENITGTYFHGIFLNDEFRERLLNSLRHRKGLPPIVNRTSFARLREESFDRLAAVVREHVSLELIYRKMAEFQEKE
jgi:adenosylcobyric acid synthase